MNTTSEKEPKELTDKEKLRQLIKEHEWCYSEIGRLELKKISLKLRIEKVYEGIKELQDKICSDEFDNSN